MNTFIKIPANKASLGQRTLVQGLGINDADYQITQTIDGKKTTCPYYLVWQGMLARCYSDKFHIKNPTYKGCSVCKDWLLFSNFKNWMQQQDWENKSIDKDLLVVGNKIYSPETCLFVTHAINNLFTDCRAKRGLYDIGVTWNKETGKYKAYCRNGSGKQISLGYHLIEQDAHKAYLAFKKNVIIDIANNQTDLKLKTALLSISELY